MADAVIWKAALLWRGVLLCCLALAPAQGCLDDDLCRGEEPSFQVDVIPGAGVKVSTLAELVVTVRAGSFWRSSTTCSTLLRWIPARWSGMISLTSSAQCWST